MDYIGRALVADALQEWRSQLQALASSSPLRDLDTSDAPLLDLDGAHPGGLAQLFASRPTLLSTLVRDPDEQARALHTGGVMREHAAHAKQTSGVATGALTVGVVSWTEPDGAARSMPLLLRPVTLWPARETDTEVTLQDTVRINPVFAAELRARGVVEPLDSLADASLAGKEFDPRPLWNRVRSMVATFGDDLAVEETLLLGSFDDPEQRLVDDLDECDHLVASSLLLASVAGDSGAHDTLSMPLPIVGAADRDPFAERGLGQLDDIQFSALDMVATGRSVFVQTPPGADLVGMAAAIAADGAASGKSVALVSGGTVIVDDIASALDAAGAGELYVSATEPGWNATARQRLLSSITTTGRSIDEAALRRDGERLLAARSELRARMEDLHLVWEPWGVSAYQAVQALVRLTSVENPPTTSVRLAGEMAATVAERGLRVVAEAGARAYAARRGVHEDGTPVENEPEKEQEKAQEAPQRWWQGTILDETEGARLDATIVSLLNTHIPALREDSRLVAAEVALDEAGSLATWREQLDLCERVRQTLDTFQPAVFSHSYGDVVAATAPEGSPYHGDMPRRERKAIAKRAKELLRPNRPDAHLHERLLEARHVKVRWQQQSSVGAVPSVPDNVDAAAARLGVAAQAWSTVAAAVEAVTGVPRLADQSWDVLTETLTALVGDEGGPLAEVDVKATEEDLERAGFGELLEDLQAREVPPERAAAEFEFAWWAAAFDSMVAHAPSLATYGSVGNAVREFLARDAEFGEARSGPLMRAVGERRRAAIARHQDHARDLFAALVEGGDGPYRDLWQRFPDVVTALRPVTLTPAEQVSHIAPAERVLDTVVLVGVESLAFAEVVPALARTRQVVVLADAQSATNSAVRQLRETLPGLALHARPQPRDPRVTAVLDDHGYAGELEMFLSPDPGGLEWISVDTVANPELGAAHVTSTRAEVVAVVERLSRAAMADGSTRLAVVAGNEAHAIRVRAALAERGSSSIQDVPVVTMGEAAGIEADLVILTLGWAPDHNGAVAPRLGTLSTGIGARALRQAMVASSRDLVVVTALHPQHVADAAAGSDLGHGLDMFADLAAVAEAGELGATEGPSHNWVLADIAERIRTHGLKVGVRYGVGPAVIPLVVAASENDDFSVAVVTDETPPPAGVSLRDFVRRQQAQLELLGWTVVPLWTVDAFADPQAAAAEVLAAFGLPAVKEAGLETLAMTPPPRVEEALSDAAPPPPPPVPPRPAHGPTTPAGLPTVPQDSPPPPSALPRGEPVLPSRSRDDSDEGWSERDPDSREQDMRRERPPHWGED